jgi:hypothetical protein
MLVRIKQGLNKILIYMYYSVMHNNFIHLYPMHTVPRTIGYYQVLGSHRMQEVGHLHLFGAGRYKDNIYYKLHRRIHKGGDGGLAPFLS